MGIYKSALFHDAFLDHALEIFWSEKCAVLLNWLMQQKTSIWKRLNTIILFSSQTKKWSLDSSNK